MNYFNNIIMKLLICLVALILVCHSLPKLPLYLGKGYNILEGNPMSQEGVDPGFSHQIFTFTYNNGEETEDGKFLVPDDVSHRKTTACSFSSKVSQFRGTQSYQKDLKIKTQINGMYNGPLVQAAFSQSSTYERMKNITTMENNTVTQASAQCSAYEMSLNLFKVNKITENFWEGLRDSYKSNDWSEFIDQFGTHYAYEVILGGRAVQEIEYDWKSVAEFKSLDIDINLAAKASFAKLYVDSSFDYHKYEVQTKYAETFSRSITELYVGGKPSFNGNISEWQQKIIEDPMPINCKLLPLSDLFKFYTGTDIDLTNAVIKFTLALNNYCFQRGCKKPEPDLPQPPKPTITSAQTKAYGGNGGGDYSWSHIHPTLSLKKVLVRCGERMDQIQLFLSDGVTNMYTPEFGGNGGGPAQWTVPDGEHITQLEYRSGTKVDSISFITNKGTKSPHFGGYGGGYNLQTLPDGYRIVGLYGRSGSEVDRLGFWLAKTNFQTGQVEIIKKNLIVDE